MINFSREELLTEICNVNLDFVGIAEQLEKLLVEREIVNKLIQIDVQFVSIEGITEINTVTRKKTEPTDVLSFEPPFQENPIGEIYICPKYIIDALVGNLSDVNDKIFLEEVLRLFIHGVLHVYGMEHKEHLEYGTNKSDEDLFKLQEEFLTILAESL